MNDDTRETGQTTESESSADSENPIQDGQRQSDVVDDEAADKDVDNELVNILEAAIFSSDDPVGVRKLIAMFPRNAAPSRIDIQNALLRIQQNYEGRGIELRRIGKGWRFQSREKYSDWLKQLFKGKSPRYSRALLETLSIVAYRQPVTRGDIEEIRGITVSSETVRILLDREWVQEVGHRDVPGRPALLGTTDSFLQYFNLGSLKDLPELLAPREIGEIASELNFTLPMDGIDTHTEDEGTDEHTAKVIPLHPDGPGDPLDAADEEEKAPVTEGTIEENEELADDSPGSGGGEGTPDDGEDS
jgi:segregation and condensation protein B